MESNIQKQPFNILLATDGSEHAMAAASLVNDLALPPGSTVTIVAVLLPRQASSLALLEDALEQTRPGYKILILTYAHNWKLAILPKGSMNYPKITRWI
jgi:hypothetical protein